MHKLAVTQLVKKFLSLMEHKASFHFHVVNAITTQLNTIHTLTFLKDLFSCYPLT
jgi:hypothetical protein